MKKSKDGTVMHGIGFDVGDDGTFLLEHNEVVLGPRELCQRVEQMRYDRVCGGYEYNANIKTKCPLRDPFIAFMFFALTCGVVVLFIYGLTIDILSW